jgi:hypothetical protein
MKLDQRRLLYWSEPGILIRGGKRVSDETFEHPGVKAVVIRWGEVREVEPVDPWPALRIDALSWRTYHEETLTSYNGFDREDFARHVERFVNEVATRTPGALRRGWLERADVEWEPVRRMPGDHAEERGDGFYRTGQPVDPKVLASRPGSRLPMTRGHLPHEIRDGEVALTEDQIFVRYSRRRVFRLDLSQLVARREEPERHVVRYIFGRRAALLLTPKHGCAVMRRLDDLIAIRSRRSA